MGRYSIVTWHGEAKTLFYVVDNDAPDEVQPCVASCHHSRVEALGAVDALLDPVNAGVDWARRARCFAYAQHVG